MTLRHLNHTSVSKYCRIHMGRSQIDGFNGRMLATSTQVAVFPLHALLIPPTPWASNSRVGELKRYESKAMEPTDLARSCWANISRGSIWSELDEVSRKAVVSCDVDSGVGLSPAAFSARGFKQMYYDIPKINAPKLACWRQNAGFSR